MSSRFGHGTNMLHLSSKRSVNSGPEIYSLSRKRYSLSPLTIYGCCEPVNTHLAAINAHHATPSAYNCNGKHAIDILLRWKGRRKGRGRRTASPKGGHNILAELLKQGGILSAERVRGFCKIAYQNHKQFHLSRYKTYDNDWIEFFSAIIIKLH